MISGFNATNVIFLFLLPRWSLPLLKTGQIRRLSIFWTMRSYGPLATVTTGRGLLHWFMQSSLAALYLTLSFSWSLPYVMLRYELCSSDVQRMFSILGIFAYGSAPVQIVYLKCFEFFVMGLSLTYKYSNRYYRDASLPDIQGFPAFYTSPEK